MQPRVLLLNPPIHDFSAYDFWLRPYGLLRAAGALRGRAELQLFDFLDRLDPRMPRTKKMRADQWGRGEFFAEPADKPAIFENIPRRWHRIGLPRAEFQSFLQRSGPFDFALVQTLMTYWYLGPQEVLEDLRRFSPQTKVIFGGVYATLCAAHAKALRPDFVLEGTDLNPLWQYMQIDPNAAGLPLWELYPKLSAGVVKLADGCPFKCTYCSVPQVYPRFQMRPLERSLAEVEHLQKLGAENIAFYDDALLYQPEQILLPFLREVLKRGIRVNFHTPNAINARFVTKEMAELMVRAGFKVIYLGFESSAYDWQFKTGGKVYNDELARAIDHLVAAGADINNICAYIIVAHPENEAQNVEASMRYASSLGIRVMLSEFSPIPNTPDGESCRRWIDLDEPLYHNKTAFPFFSIGADEINRLKQLCKELNARPLETAYERR